MTAQGWARVAAVGYLAGLAMLFGLRTWRHSRSTGTSGLNGFSRRDRWARVAGLMFAVAVLTGTAALVLAALILAIELQVRCLEEPYLAGIHGPRHHDYTTRVGRFGPLIGRHHRTLTGSR